MSVFALSLRSILSTYLLQKTLRKQSDSILGTWHVSETEPGHVSLASRRSTPERRLSDYAVTGQGQVNNFSDKFSPLGDIFGQSFTFQFTFHWFLFIVFKVCTPLPRHNSIERSHDVSHSVNSASRAKLGPLQLECAQAVEYTGPGNPWTNRFSGSAEADKYCVYK